jgi:hypothetical protein
LLRLLTAGYGTSRWCRRRAWAGGGNGANGSAHQRPGGKAHPEPRQGKADLAPMIDADVAVAAMSRRPHPITAAPPAVMRREPTLPVSKPDNGETSTNTRAIGISAMPVPWIPWLVGDKQMKMRNDICPHVSSGSLAWQLPLMKQAKGELIHEA